MEPLLKVENIKKTYGKSSAAYTALENISFDIHEGEFVGIMGPSGAGKSTLLNMLATIDSPTEGKIYMNDTSIHDMKGADLTDRHSATFQTSIIPYSIEYPLRKNKGRERYLTNSFHYFHETEWKKRKYHHEKLL